MLRGLDVFTRLGKNRRLLILLALGALLLLCMLIAVSIGAVSISPLNIMKMVMDKIKGYEPTPENIELSGIIGT